MNKPKAVVVGISGKVLTKEENHLLKNKCPFGVILFSRNIISFNQVKSLVFSIKDAASWNIPIFIDQEGGKVQRLRGNFWPSYPSSSVFGKIAEKSIKFSKEATYLNYQLIADDLSKLGINVNCSPCLDIYFSSGNKIIGNRAFSKNPTIVYKLGKVACESMMKRGIIPVIKHIPGHGRADADSHKKLPIVKEDIETLDKSDFIPFKKLNYIPLAMTAHILFKYIDSVYPVSLSSKAINFIRNNLLFEGILLSDDIEMSALSGNLEIRAKDVINAGCDIVLYCGANNYLNEKILDIVPSINPMAWKKWITLSNQINKFIKPLEVELVMKRLNYLINRYSR